MIEPVPITFWDKNYHPEFGLIVDAEECRLLLRPHGRSATSIRRFRVPGQWHTEYAAGFLRISYLTRAQAAQAAYENS